MNVNQCKTRITLAFTVVVSTMLIAAPKLAAQGTVFFFNYAPSVGLDAPVYDVGGTKPVQENYFVAQLLAGPNANQLSAIGPLVAFGPEGYWEYGDLVRSIPTVAPGAPPFLRVRVWSTVTGQSYDQVLQAGGKHGESSVFSVITGGDTLGDTQPPSFPAFLVGLTSFTLVGIDPTIPEPCSLVMFSLGLFLLLCWRRN